MKDSDELQPLRVFVDTSISEDLHQRLSQHFERPDLGIFVAVPNSFPPSIDVTPLMIADSPVIYDSIWPEPMEPERGSSDIRSSKHAETRRLRFLARMRRKKRASKK